MILRSAPGLRSGRPGYSFATAKYLRTSAPNYAVRSNPVDFEQQQGQHSTQPHRLGAVAPTDRECTSGPRWRKKSWSRIAGDSLSGHS
jgi:hypothetical protein